jgi:hypothetical protein
MVSARREGAFDAAGLNPSTARLMKHFFNGKKQVCTPYPKSKKRKG